MGGCLHINQKASAKATEAIRCNDYFALNE